MLELTDEVSTAKKAASIAQEGLEAAKEEARPLRERAFAAEALLQELQEKREAATRTADDAEEVLRKEKVGGRLSAGGGGVHLEHFQENLIAVGEVVY